MQRTRDAMKIENLLNSPQDTQESLTNESPVFVTRGSNFGNAQYLTSEQNARQQIHLSSQSSFSIEVLLDDERKRKGAFANLKNTFDSVNIKYDTRYLLAGMHAFPQNISVIFFETFDDKEIIGRRIKQYICNRIYESQELMNSICLPDLNASFVLGGELKVEGYVFSGCYFLLINEDFLNEVNCKQYKIYPATQKDQAIGLTEEQKKVFEKVLTREGLHEHTLKANLKKLSDSIDKHRTTLDLYTNFFKQNRQKDTTASADNNNSLSPRFPGQNTSRN